MNRPGQSACPDRRDRLIAVAGGVAQRDALLDAHLVVCSGCSAYLGRAQSHVHSLTGLPRRAVPVELDGLAVAATQAGFRQDRAVNALLALSQAAMPEEVDLSIWPRGVRAPTVLDRLVDCDLQEQTNGIARRFAGRLERLRAPRALDGRVGSIHEPHRLRRDRFTRRVALVSAALLLVALGALGTLIAMGRRTVVPVGPDSGPVIVIERVASPAELDPVLQQTFAALVGGAPDAERAVKEKL